MLPILDEAFTSWGLYLSLGIPSALMKFSEYSIFEIMALMAAYKGNIVLATMSVLTNILAIGYETTAGLSSSLTSLMGRLLGEERED
jgi:Na+-driven multidrug efflux pump